MRIKISFLYPQYNIQLSAPVCEHRCHVIIVVFILIGIIRLYHIFVYDRPCTVCWEEADEADCENERQNISYRWHKENGIESEKEEINENITVERVKIKNEEGQKAIGKPIGNYITIDIKKLKIAQDEDIEKSAETLSKELTKILEKI